MLFSARVDAAATDDVNTAGIGVLPGRHQGIDAGPKTPHSLASQTKLHPLNNNTDTTTFTSSLTVISMVHKEKFPTALSALEERLRSNSQQRTLHQLLFFFLLFNMVMVTAFSQSKCEKKAADSCHLTV